MSSIFETNRLYPDYDTPIKRYFADYFDCVYVCFSPFFILKENKEGTCSNRSKIISLEELQAADIIFKNLDPSVNRVIYSNDNFSYPATEEIVSKGLIITWKYIKEKASFANYSEINTALRTSIGALRSDFERKDLQKKLDAFTDQESIYNPGEGRITPLSLVQIYLCLRSLKKFELVVTDEFFENRFTINLLDVTCSEFIEKTFGYMYYFPKDRSLLFTIEWDSFFYLITGNEKLLRGLIKAFGFEGFYATDVTTHSWEYD